MRPNAFRPIALSLVAVLALAGCAGKKDPSADGLTTTSDLGTFGPSSPAGAAPGGFGDGTDPTFGVVDGSDLIAGGGIPGAIDGGPLGGTGGVYTSQGAYDTGAGNGFIDGGVITQTDPNFYDQNAFADGTVQQSYDSTLFESTGPLDGANAGGYTTYGEQGGANSLTGYSFPGDDGRPAYFNTQVGNRVLFETDSHTLTANARETLRRQAAWMQLHPQNSATIEGHADERGTREYNLALGDRRASAARNYMISLGVRPDRLLTVSFGKERPISVGSNPAGWAQNRRVETVLRDGASF